LNTSWPGSLHVASVCTPPRPASRLRVTIRTRIYARVFLYMYKRVAGGTPGIRSASSSYRVLPTVGATNLNTHVDACEDCTYTAYLPEPTSRCQTNTHNTTRLAPLPCMLYACPSHVCNMSAVTSTLELPDANRES